MSTSLDIITKAVTFGTIEDTPVSTIIEGLVIADDLYYNDEESPLTDAQYDALRLYAQRVEPTNVYFTGVGSQVRGGKVPLPHTMGSLNQIYQGDYTKWVEKHKLQDEVIIISNKLDGNSGMVVYGKDKRLQIAYSRGDGVNGADITRHISKIHNVPQTIQTDGETITIRGEVIITPANFNKIKDKVLSKSGRKYKNPRNFVSGRMNASEGQDIVYSHIDFVVYEIVDSPLSKSEQLEKLAKYGFKTVEYTKVRANALCDNILTSLLEQAKEHSEYELDGVVLDVDSSKARKNINPTKDTLNPEYSVKFKVADASNYAETEVISVIWSVSKDGYLKPTVQFKPINIVGVTIQNCTGFNAKFIKENNIGPGAIIAIVRSGDVIPFLTNVVKPAVEPDMPSEDAYWTETGVDLVVADAKNHPTVKFQQLNDFFSSLDVPSLGEGNLRPMFDAGFETPESIIELTQEDIGSLVGSMVIGKKIFAGIREKLTNVPMYVLMGSHPALGRGIGKRKMKRLYEAFAGDMTKCANVDSIVPVEGFDTKSATKVANGYPEFMVFFNKIEKFTSIAQFVAPKSGNMSGFAVCYTGIRSKEQEQAIEAAGGKVVTSVSSKTTHLVTNDPDSNSGKAQKARSVGVKVVGINEMWALIKG